MNARLAGLLAPGPTRVMAVLNVTADSFSDGGAWLDPDRAVAHGLALAGQGAAVVDVGGESTRPGSARVPAAVEAERVVPVVAALARAGVAVSVDTTRAEVAAAALAAGAVIVNDVSGGLADPAMTAVVADSAAAYVVGHWRGWLDEADSQAVYGDVVAETLAELTARLDAVAAAGVPWERLIADPGLGFAKTADHNWTLLRAADRFARLGLPVLWGASRKRFLAAAYAQPTAPAERDAATAAVTAYLAAHGAWAVRTHTVAEHVAAVAVAGRLAASAALPAGRERIELTGLEAWGRHGVFDFEKAAPQLFRVDVQADLAPVPDRPDDLAATVDYGRVSRAVAEVVAGPPCELVETLAEHVAGAVLGLGGLAAVAVTVHKPQAPLPEPFADVAVTVRREAPRPRRRVVVSAGSNLDDRLALLQFGVAALATTPGLAATAVSGVYETAPVGAEGQSDYLNLVFVGESDLPAEALLERCLAIEHAAGRRRGHSAGPAPRRLDLDLIAVGDERAATDRLTLPHPRAGQRAFVLVPWLEADPAARLDGRPLAAWLAETAGQTVRRRDDLAVVGVRPAPTGGTGRA